MRAPRVATLFLENYFFVSSFFSFFSFSVSSRVVLHGFTEEHCMLEMNIFTQIIRPDLLGNSDKTFAIKANIASRRFPASSVTPSLQGWIPRNPSPIVLSLIESGYQLVAIANMHELALGVSCENPVSGDVENPRCPGYIPGGSSGGSAAAVAMKAVTFALGTDTAGSMRIPAALCGVVGYRPSTKLYSTVGMCPLCATTDTIGIFANEVGTIQQVHKVIQPSYAPEKCSLSGVRVGVPAFYYTVLDGDVSSVTAAALECLKKAGAELVGGEVDVSLPSELATDLDMLDSFSDLIVYEAYHLIPQYLKEEGASVSFEELCEKSSATDVRENISTGDRVSEERYKECQQLMQKIREMFHNYFKVNNLDIIAVPTTILPALKRPSPSTVQVAGRDFPIRHAYVRNAALQAIAGLPCISIPSGLSSEGCPVGLEIVGPPGADSAVINLAAVVQEALPPFPQLNFDDF